MCPNRYTVHNTQKTYGNTRVKFTEFWCSVWSHECAFTLCTLRAKTRTTSREKEKKRDKPFYRPEKGEKIQSSFSISFCFRCSYLTTIYTSLRVDSQSALMNIFHSRFHFSYTSCDCKVTMLPTSKRCHHEIVFSWNHWFSVKRSWYSSCTEREAKKKHSHFILFNTLIEELTKVISGSTQIVVRIDHRFLIKLQN